MSSALREWIKVSDVKENYIREVDSSILKALMVKKNDKFPADIYDKNLLKNSQRRSNILNENLWDLSQQVVKIVGIDKHEIQDATQATSEERFKDLKVVEETTSDLMECLSSLSNWRKKNEEAYQDFSQVLQSGRINDEERARIKKSMRGCIYNEKKMAQIVEVLIEEEENWTEALENIRQRSEKKEIIDKIDEIEDTLRNLESIEEDLEGELEMPEGVRPLN